MWLHVGATEPKKILDKVADPENACWRPIREIVLTDEEIAQMRGGTNRQTRKELAEKWSFSGIVRHFATSNSPQWKSVSMLSHGYGNSSHLIHKDGDGVGMVWDRCRRDSHRQTAVTLAHAARLVSDICAFGQLRVHTLLRACRSSTNAVAEIAEKYDCLRDQLREANEWFTSVEYQGP